MKINTYKWIKRCLIAILISSLILIELLLRGDHMSLVPVSISLIRLELLGEDLVPYGTNGDEYIMKYSQHNEGFKPFIELQIQQGRSFITDTPDMKLYFTSGDQKFYFQARVFTRRYRVIKAESMKIISKK